MQQDATALAVASIANATVRFFMRPEAWQDDCPASWTRYRIRFLVPHDYQLHSLQFTIWQRLSGVRRRIVRLQRNTAESKPRFRCL